MEKQLTIITPFFNAEQLLSSYFQTILQQSKESLEAVSFIWIDDGSTDDTYIRLKQFVAKHDLDIQLLKVEINSGPSIARDSGIQATRTKWIAYLDADDSWYMDALRVLLAHTKIDFDIVFSSYYIWDPRINRGQITALKASLDSHNLRLPDLLEKQNVSAPLGVMHTKEIYEKAGGFPPYIVCGEDGILWRRIVCNQHARYTFNEDPIGLYLCRTDSQCRTGKRFLSGKNIIVDYKNHLGLNGQYLDGFSKDELEQFLECVSI